MSATNHTTNYELPIFVGTDKPAWLVDWNSAMTAIDTAIHTAEGKADQAGTDIGGIESSISTINSTLTSINNAVSQLRLDTNANTGSIHTIQELIGNGTPTTTDKTIIGAINELNAQDQTTAELARELFSLEQVSTSSLAITSTVGSVDANDTSIKALQSATDKLLKLFGSINLYNLSLTGGTDVTLATISNTGLTIPNEFIVSGFPATRVISGTVRFGRSASLKFKTDGNVDVFFPGSAGSATFDSIVISIPPVLLINSAIE